VKILEAHFFSGLDNPAKVSCIAMKLKQMKEYKSWLIVLIGVALVVSSMQVTVLCRAEDGHVAVEFVGNICCDNVNTTISSENSTTSLNEAFLSSKDNCGPCVDTFISVEAIQVFEKTNPANSTIAVSSTIVTSAVRSYDFAGYQLDSERFASINPCLASLRTIILLT
jgi:hypothetical protein